MKNLQKILIMALCCMALAANAAAGNLLADTLRFRFLLHGQTRRAAMVAETEADGSVLLRWTMRSGKAAYGSVYAMGAKSVERGQSLCFLQPAPAATIQVPVGQTAFMLSRQAFATMRQSGRFSYGGATFSVVDTVACAPGVGSFHVRDSVEGCEMWIADNPQLPLIWQMRGNPLEIDWTVDNAAVAMDSRRRLLRVAFISDPHVMDVDGQPSHVRPLADELRSTRLFNENEYAFRAALDDAARRGISLVVLPGDLTDNGQTSCQKAVAAMLNSYSRRYGMRFFATTGNHDPARPWLADSVQSGFFPRADYRYWATPFSAYTPRTYTLDKARREASVERRAYMMADGVVAYDASYVVEPVDGLWLLAIDGGTFLPTPDGRHQCYGGASPGYAEALRHKPFLLPWIRRVVADARRYGKRVVAFCHYPPADYTSGAAAMARAEWGAKSLQLDRLPSDSVAWVLADCGVDLHFAGHMHQNHSVDVVSPSGNRMHCEQVPSTAMYVPGYKILTLDSLGGGYTIETVGIDSVPGMERLLPAYLGEYGKAKAMGEALPWSQDDLYSMADYGMFCDMHLRHLVDLRMAKRDLPDSLVSLLVGHDARQLAAFCGIGAPVIGWHWCGHDMLYDFYRLLYGGSAALAQMPPSRLEQYSAMFASLDGMPHESAQTRQLAAFGRVLACLLASAKGR